MTTSRSTKHLPERRRGPGHRTKARGCSESRSGWWLWSDRGACTRLDFLDRPLEFVGERARIRGQEGVGQLPVVPEHSLAAGCEPLPDLVADGVQVVQDRAGVVDLVRDRDTELVR